MQKLISFLFSMLFTGILITVFAISIAYATFIENDYGTQTAKILIYNSRWFEFLLLLIMINLTGSIFVNKLISKKKWTIFLFHLAFIIIIIGAAITRYTSFEGSMHIREGSTSSQIISESTYVTIKAKKGNQESIKQKEVKFSGYTGNKFKEEIYIDEQKVTIKSQQFVPSAAETVVEDPTGSPILAVLAVGTEMQRADFILKPGQTKLVKGLTFGFSSKDEQANISFTEKNGQIFFTSSDTILKYSTMGSAPEKLAPGQQHPFSENKVFQLGYTSFMLKKFYQKGSTRLIHVPQHNGAIGQDALHVAISLGNQSRELFVFGTKGVIGQPAQTSINGIEVAVSYGAKLIKLPFSLKLNDFQLERYPGSNSPSSYASEVVLIDKTNQREFPYRIFMNNILKYKGYRFFQSSFDQDEKGTILSVNHDFWGTFTTYIGYLIMVLGMVFTLFNKNSRFKRLVRASTKLRVEKAKYFTVLGLGVLLSFTLTAQTNEGQPINKQHINKFRELLVQTNKGRIEPVNTLASEILRKVSRENNINGMPAAEVFLDMQIHPEKWKNIPLIKVSNPRLRKIIGIADNLAPLNSVVTQGTHGGYKLQGPVQKAYEKKPALRDKFDKEVINVDERVNILIGVLSGQFLSIFPVPNDENNKWVSVANGNLLGEKGHDEANALLTGYFRSVQEAMGNGNWAKADEKLKKLKENQLTFGTQLIPPTAKIKLEVFYTHFNIFGKLAKAYLFTGLFFLLLLFISLFKPKLHFRVPIKIISILIILLFITHTAGLGIRWYISSHAPWSNGYESMIFISWATCLAGLAFARRSQITLSLTTILAALTLLVAGMSWMSPEITNLVPVLKSYWLIVHVAIITASYGFLGIGALLGLLNLILMTLRTSSNISRLTITIKELVYIIEMALIIGLFMLTIGSFIGGVWANESWGRYWGWDPKETWALVTILVYSFIIHMHKIPGFKGHFQVSAAALVGFGSVLMTYFGVNYYLSGLHSYAGGEAVPIPVGVYIAIVIVVMMIFLAYISEHYSKNKKSVVIVDDL